MYAKTKNSTNVIAVPTGMGTVSRQGTIFNSRAAFVLNNNKDTQEIKNFNDSTP
jgi:hypothetical protein